MDCHLNTLSQLSIRAHTSQTEQDMPEEKSLTATLIETMNSLVSFLCCLQLGLSLSSERSRDNANGCTGNAA
jgi:hypothetical protein